MRRSALSGGEASTRRSCPAGFVRVPLTCLHAGSEPTFAVYLLRTEGEPPVLYSERSTPFTQKARNRLLGAGTSTILIPANDDRLFRQYVESHIEALLTDSNLSTEEKSEVVYHSACELMLEAMEDPRTANLVSRSENIVGNTVDFMHTHRTAFRSLVELASYDYYTHTHSVNVFVISTALAQHLGHSKRNTLREFGVGALLHDIGKSRLDPTIINSKERLTDEQWQSIKTHPLHSYNILREHGVTDDLALNAARHHHEKLNGSGYPDGLAAGELLPHVRILTIADIFDALTTRRSYKDAIPSFDALDLMLHEMAAEIDREYLMGFIHIMGRKGHR